MTDRTTINGKPKREFKAEDAAFLAKLSDELNAQSTDGNRDPRFWTVRDHEMRPCWSEQAEEYALVDDEGNVVGRVDFEIDAGELMCVPQRDIAYVCEDTLFLTKKEAEAHIRLNRHNYHDPFTYVQTAERSPQFEQLIAILQEVEWGDLI